MHPIIPFMLCLVACGPLASGSGPAVSTSPTDPSQRDDLAYLYPDQQVTGSFILHDLGTGAWTYIDSAAADGATLPASTFKIFSSLYGLESGVVKDAEDMFKWDGKDYGRAEINQDLTLRQAFQRSAYWFHRDIARRAGATTLKHWLDTVGYGNEDTSGGYDRTWVAGNLRITPRQQVDFLDRLVKNELPFSQRSMDIVKDISLQEDTLGYRVYGKTGWAMGSEGSIGWFVGWVEKSNGSGPFVFANRVMTRDTLSRTFGPSRRAISIEALERLGILPK